MSFQGNNIDNEGAIAIADALKVNCTLTWISKCANQNMDALSTSPNEPSLEWSSVSISSSIHSNENGFDDDSAKRPQDFISNDIYLGTNEPDSLLYYKRQVRSPRSKPSYNSSSTTPQRGKSPSFDDGLSKMTSALLTMLDSPEECDNGMELQPKVEEKRLLCSDVGFNRGSTPPLINGLGHSFDLQDHSHAWFSGLDR